MMDAVGPWFLVGLWLGAIILPLCVFPVSPVGGVLLGIGLPALYLAIAPKTCMDGGGIMGCPLAACQGAMLLIWLAAGAGLLVRALR